MRSTRSALLPSSELLTLILCILIFSTLGFAVAPDRITSPVASGQLIKLLAGVPMKAKPQYDQGPADPSLKLSYMTLLTVPSATQQKAINQLLAQQQDPRSPLYHKWLTPEQYADRFGLSPNDIQKLTAWLQSQGFTIGNVARARNFIVFSGTAAQAENAFQTQIHNFEVSGEKHFSNTTSPSIPTALSSVVTGIRGLSNFHPKSYLQRRKPNYTYPIPGTNPQEYNLYLAPGDIETIYDIGPLYTAGIDGSGQTLAVVGQTDVYLADLNDFRTGFSFSNIPTSGPGSCATDASGLIILPCTTTTPGAAFKYVLVNADPGVPTSSDDLGEADLDLEWSAATVPNAQIIFVNAPDPNGDGVWDSWYYAVDNDVAPVITMSYGICELGEALTPGGQGTIKPNEGTFSSDEAELKQANMAGITFMNASGDSGAAGCDPNETDPDALLATGGVAVGYPASSPEVTGVGGTAATISEISTDAGKYWEVNNGPNGGSAQTYIPEAPWNDAFEIGAFCAANPSDCTGITNAETAQAAIGMASSGGGPSNCMTISGSGECTGGFPQPIWQQGLSISGQAAVRFTPDVSLMASPALPGYIWCTNNGSCAGGIPAAIADNSIVGGTSASTPIFAGMVTLLNQYVAVNFPSEPLPFGNINPNLYQIATYNQAARPFNQITASDFAAAPGSNQVYCHADTPSGQPMALVCPAAVKPATEGLFGYLSSASDATTGYNLVTGLGSVDVSNLATAWGDLYTVTTTSVSIKTAPPIFEGQSVTFDVAVTPATATGAAAFFNNGAVFGSTTAAVTGGAATFATSQLPVGANSVYAVYTGIYATSTSSAHPQTVTVLTPNFTLTPTTAAITVAQGATAGPDTITVTSSNGFVADSATAEALTYSCSGLPSEAACVFNPTTATTSATVTVSITTTAPTSGRLRAPLGHGNGIRYAMLLPGLVGIFFAFGSRKSRTRSLRLLSLLVALGLSTIWLAACGGGSGGGSTGNPGTPQGMYTITVNATTGTIPATTPATVMLTVN
ncbi:MAG TPA: protease pro-enzyme activation domain-containing protein [Terriglobales bacterium]|nr:protease pro-enzyme activation domain-containing protein [Terriglobales bacterium]